MSVGGAGPELDLLVVGSGVAGLSAAVRAAAREPGMRVGVLTKADLATSATAWAQGGVAAVLAAGPGGDSVGAHLADTLAAGAGLCDADAVGVLVGEGPGRVRELAAQGASFDLDDDGGLALAREGGHSHARVVHAGGAATGIEIERTLVAATRATAAEVREGWHATDLLVERGTCRGVLALDPSGATVAVRASHTLLATGGAGQLYSVTTNPPQATGDGQAMAIRAGVAVADVEFVQFHPTALHDGSQPRALLSEAVRGEGAVLRDRAGRRFVDELAPRDVVSRAIAATMLEEGSEHVWLDATGIDGFAAHFPTLVPPLARLGIDPAHDWLPVAPAAHYLCGGAMVDLDGATTLPGLWAAGEAACSGVHGANRLASNSLLEGMVWAARVVDAVLAGKRAPQATGVLAGLDAVVPGGAHLPVRRLPPAAAAVAGEVDPVKGREALQRAMSGGAGVVRTAASLAATRREVSRLWPAAGGVAAAELRDLCTVATHLLDAAEARAESRGCHTRADAPGRRDEQLVRWARP